MNIEEIREYCMSKKGTSESFPFDEVTLVFKVMGKIFALTNLDGDLSINLKCDPEIAISLREEFPAIIPGFHMGKSLWNTVFMDGSLNDDFVKKLIDDSYNLIVEKLPKKVKLEFEKL